MAEKVPQVGGDELAEGGGTRFVVGVGWVDEVERPLEVESGVGEGNVVCPRNIFGCGGGGGGWELDAFLVVYDTVRTGCIAMPEWPPSLVVLR